VVGSLLGLDYNLENLGTVRMKRQILLTQIALYNTGNDHQAVTRSVVCVYVCVCVCLSHLSYSLDGHVLILLHSMSAN